MLLTFDCFQIQDRGITTYAIGIGNGTDNILQLATQPAATHAYQVDSTDDLGSTISQLITEDLVQSPTSLEVCVLLLLLL